MNVNNGKKIGLDLDGVIIDLSLHKAQFAKEYGIEISLQQTPSNIFHTVVPQDIFKKIQDKLYEDPAYAPNLPFMKGAYEALLKIKDFGQEFYLLSQRKNQAMAVNLLKNRGLWPHIFNQENVFFVPEAKEKEEVGRKLGINYYVDDWLTVLRLFESVPHKFLFDPFDVYTENAIEYTLVHSWDELLPYFLN